MRVGGYGKVGFWMIKTRRAFNEGIKLAVK